MFDWEQISKEYMDSNIDWDFFEVESALTGTAAKHWRVVQEETFFDEAEDESICC